MRTRLKILSFNESIWLILKVLKNKYYHHAMHTVIFFGDSKCHKPNN